MSRTVLARIEISAGEVDALHAVRFARAFPPHFHETFALGVVEEGSVEIRTAAGRWTARAGSLLAFAPGEVHAARPVDARGWSYRMLYPGGTLLEGLGVEGDGEHAPRFRTAVIGDGALAHAFREDHHRLMGAQHTRRAEGSMARSLATLFRRHGSAVPGTEPRTASSRAVARAREILEARVAERITVKAVAAECGLSVYHFIRSFRLAVGVPPHAYLLMLRVNRARRMLGDGRRVSEVAFACGFADQSHLTRVFKRVVGVPPGQYAAAGRSIASS